MLTQHLIKITALGGEWVLWVLIALSMISLSAVVDRWWFYRRRRVDAEALAKRVLEALDQGDRAGADAVLAASRSVEAAVARRCLQWLDDGPDAMGEALAATLKEQRPLLDKGMLTLGTIGNNAPFIGLLGTVLGVVEAFQKLEGGPGGDMGAVMVSIAEALVATAAGIAVAVPAVIAFNFFSTKSADVQERATALVGWVMAKQRSRKSGAGQER